MQAQHTADLRRGPDSSAALPLPEAPLDLRAGHELRRGTSEAAASTPPSAGGSWNPALGETGPRSRYPREGKGKGKTSGAIEQEAIIEAASRPQLLEISGADREQ